MLRTAFLVLFAFTLARGVHAQEIDARLCDVPRESSIGSRSTAGQKDTDWTVTMIASCTKLPLANLDLSDSRFVTALQGWKEELGKEKAVEIAEIYRYSLTIANDGKTEAVIGFFDSNPGVYGFLFSPYTSMAKNLGFKVSGCTRIVMSFLAPDAPKHADTQFVIAGDHHKDSGYGWRVHSRGRANILLPRGGLLVYEEGIRTELLPKAEAETLACR